MDVLAPLPKRKYKCNICDKAYNTKVFLSSHEKKVHKIQYVKESGLYDCPTCDFKHSDKSQLYQHFEEHHHLKIDISYFDFESYKNFEEWKHVEEKETNTKFVKRGGIQTERKTKFLYFDCHRSSYFVSKSTGLRTLKTQGSNKINGICPASLKVKINSIDGHVNVNYTKTHFGHENDLGHLCLSDSERNMLAQKIASKVPFNAILDEVRDSTTENGKLTRLHLLTRSDLHNIESSFKLNIDVKKHENDAVSIHHWVQELKNDSCILFYKPQKQIVEDYPQLAEDDFILILMNEAQKEILKKYGSDAICIDGTHGLNQYNFELISLLILDDLRQGFPCAFLISNRCDESVLSVFFSCVKQEIGEIKPQIFMSDMANAFYNAFIKVMTVPKHRLYCSWHVDRAWRKNLIKIRNKDRQVEVYKLLRTLLQETDVSTFERMLKPAIDMLLKDSTTETFGVYFVETYVNCVQSWAYCYRLFCGLNTNMHLERMHRTIKYIYFNGKNTKRLDKMLYVLMKFIRDRLYDRLITLHKGKITKKISDLRVRHKESLKLSESLIMKGDTGWNILSSNRTDLYFIKESTTDCTCNLRCLDCKTCIHNFSCTCIDYSIRWNMCKHIHLLCTSLIPKDINECPDKLNIGKQFLKDEEIVLTREILKDKLNPPTSISTKIEKLKLEFNALVDTIADDKGLQVVKNHLKSMKASIEAANSLVNNGELIKDTSTDKNMTPYNKNIIPQRLFSTKKPTKKNRKMANPSLEEQNDISFSLIIDQ